MTRYRYKSYDVDGKHKKLFRNLFIKDEKKIKYWKRVDEANEKEVVIKKLD